MPTVLIVEDEFQVLILAESMLQRAGYETLNAATVAEAQAIIHAGKELGLHPHQHIRTSGNAT